MPTLCEIAYDCYRMEVNNIHNYTTQVFTLTIIHSCFCIQIYFLPQAAETLYHYNAGVSWNSFSKIHSRTWNSVLCLVELRLQIFIQVFYTSTWHY